MRATVRLTTRCDNACRFCGQHGVAIGDEAQWRSQLEAARAGGASEVTFTGGEPTLVGFLADAIAAARSLGFVAIGVQTNGRSLRDGALVRSLRDAGLTDVHVSVHGARAAVHDYHVGVDGAFADVDVALGRLRVEGIAVVVTTVLTRSNARVVSELPAWLAHHGVRAWTIAVPHAAGRAAVEHDRVLPRLALALPFALHALDAARKRGVEVGIEGAPACLLGPWIVESRCCVLRAFAPVCEGCGARGRCAGVDAAYLERFGADELRAREGSRQVPSMSAAYMRMFVGAGELVATPVVAHEGVLAARRRLPVLMRPTPGREETRSKAKSAAELFPELGEGEE
jgi:MoaA/NifB/PqqE/SkfB family radical SAM enzyme